MSNDYKFPTDTCILACSGPSLNLVNVFELGLPVVAVSTAIRVITNPHYWVLADFLNEMHGSEGSVAYQNENICKITPKGKTHVRHKGNIRNSMDIPYSDVSGNKDSHLFSGKYPLLKGPHKSATFAIQWLHHVGVKKVIWVGNDLKANSAKEKYAYESTQTDLRKSSNYSVTIDQVYRTLKNWYPIAKKRGFEWYSWNCGSTFESFVPAFDPTTFVKDENSVFFQPTTQSSFEIVEINVSRAQKHRKTKQEKRNDRNYIKQQARETQKPNIHRKEANRQRILQQRRDKLIEAQDKKLQKKDPTPPQIQNTPKTPVKRKKYPKYVKTNPNSIRDSLR